MRWLTASSDTAQALASHNVDGIIDRRAMPSAHTNMRPLAHTRYVARSTRLAATIVC